MKIADLLPKTTNGSLHMQWKHCGRKGCRCEKGALHGPYIAFCWRASGRQKKRYVRLEHLPEVLAELEVRRAATFSHRSIRSELKEIASVCS